MMRLSLSKAMVVVTALVLAPIWQPTRKEFCHD